MNPRWRRIVGALAAVLIAVAFGAVVLSRMNAGLCGNDAPVEIKSPDGRLKAVVFERDCGATTAETTQVSLLDAGEKLPNDGGNIFVMDFNHGTASRGPAVNWEAPGKLQIEVPKGARVFKRETRLRDIEILYGELP